MRRSRMWSRTFVENTVSCMEKDKRIDGIVSSVLQILHLMTEKVRM